MPRGSIFGKFCKLFYHPRDALNANAGDYEPFQHDDTTANCKVLELDSTQ
jgi:hypothetical protein